MRIGADPSDSVLNADAESRWVQRLFIADNSALAKQKVQQARTQLGQFNFDEAERLAHEADGLGVNFASADDSPKRVLQEVTPPSDGAQPGVWSSARYCRAVGERLDQLDHGPGVLRSAYRKNVPVFVPAFSTPAAARTSLSHGTTVGGRQTSLV